ncbi:hypothetical protein [Mesorhizobium sp. YR577]|uniref:hypothetical protein n=1 Tax=Mesorhizobium sp. YR577 TaxID=1884373 RepID=UPI0008EF4401|nr:hypothetical protein [Mesorhizobium sp. YR577]SFU05749.1 hypothetical protein SAMN05518861_11111 [Mesorhizobium sp. YR577]
MVKTALGILLFALVAWHLIRMFQRSRETTAERQGLLFSTVKELLENPVVRELQAPDHPILEGQFRGLPVQLRPVVDTLAVRKLPSLWLQVTIPIATGVGGTFDFMMRPAGPTSFSNFDHLPHIVNSPVGWPDDGLLRSDNPHDMPQPGAVAPALPLFANPRMKEFLVSPKGVRIVIQIAEANRAQYGVFRQADFGDIVINPDLIEAVLTRMVAVVYNLRQPMEVAA